MSIGERELSPRTLLTFICVGVEELTKATERTGAEEENRVWCPGNQVGGKQHIKEEMINWSQVVKCSKREQPTLSNVADWSSTMRTENWPLESAMPNYWRSWQVMAEWKGGDKVWIIRFRSEWEERNRNGGRSEDNSKKIVFLWCWIAEKGIWSQEGKKLQHVCM